MLPAYPKSLSDYIELVGKVDLKFELHQHYGIPMQTNNCVTKLSYQRMPKVSFQSVGGLGEAVVHGTRSTPLQPSHSQRGAGEAGAHRGCRHNNDTELVQSVAGTV